MNSEQSGQAPLESPNPSSLSPPTRSDYRPPRKRARVACHLCHERKVRCDVSMVGSPCTNCRIDAHICSERNLTSRRAKKRLEIQGIVRSATPPGDSLSVRGPANWEPGLDRGDELSLPTTPSGNLFVDSTYEPFGGQRDGGSLTNEDFLSRILGENDNALSSGLRPSPPIGSVQPLLPFTKDQTFNSSVPFSCYRFLELRGLAGLTPEDVRYLESKGCLHVPSGPHLDQLVQQYFSHVHPFMPILDEEEFWYMYACRQHDLAKGCGLSLLVFQAMLFAASTFAPLAALRACGFHSYHSAREILHQRARLLHNFRTETDSIAIAQASLLLSFHSTPLNTHDNTSWLSTAIQYARADNSHLYYCTPGLSVRQRRQKKRLWWGCVLRDRVIALGVRRHIQVTPDHFDFHQEVPTEDDFAVEIKRSEVYDPETKRLLVRAFIVQCQLAVALTSTLMVIYPLNGFFIPVISMKSEFLKVQSQVEESKKELAKWVEVAKTQLASSPENPGTLHNSVTLYADLTYLYYFSAQMAVCHYTISILDEYHDWATDYAQQLQTARTELERGIFNVTSKVNSLVTLGLVIHVPISVIAYMALPLALLSLNVKLSSTKSEETRRKHQLAFYTEAMRLFSIRFDFADVIIHVINKLLQIADFTSPLICFHTDGGSSDTYAGVLATSANRPRSWCDILVRRPQLYLRLLFSLDYSLSRGRYPRDSELPRRALLPPPTRSQTRIEPVESTETQAQLPMLTSSDSLLSNVPLQQTAHVKNFQFGRVREASLTPPTAAMHIFGGGSPYPLLDTFGFSEHSLEMGFNEREVRSEGTGEEDPDQVLGNLISNMFDPSPTEGLR